MNQQPDMSQLPMMAMKDIPHPRCQQITALVKEQGRVTGYQLSDGRILNKADAVQLARQGWNSRGRDILPKRQQSTSNPAGSAGVQQFGQLPSVTPPHV